MKKGLIGLVIVGLVAFGGFALFNRNETHDNAMSDDMVSTDDMVKKDDMAESDDMMMNEGDMAEMFELESLEGQLVQLTDFKGEKVYVKFWASWCSICLAGLEDLDDLSAMDNDYKIITIVSPDYNGEKSADKFTAWFDKQGHDNLTVLLDTDGDVTRSFGVRGYPTSAFIGSDGVLVYMYPGHLEDDMITKTFMDIF